MAHPAVPADLLQSVVAYFGPRQVILFGSHARGEAGPDSDIDLVVVLDDDAPRGTRLRQFKKRRGLSTLLRHCSGGEVIFTVAPRSSAPCRIRSCRRGVSFMEKTSNQRAHAHERGPD